ncbi:MAG: CPBP family glutamic-type intramembrane protease [Acidimicrobiia bacterium]
MRRPDLLVPIGTPIPVESAPALRRRRFAVGVTLVVGTVLLRMTITTPRSSVRFGVLGLLLAASWIAGGLLAGPLRAPRPTRTHPNRHEMLEAAAVGLIAFIAFLGANLVARHIAVLAHALDSLLPRMSTSASTLVIAVVAANAVAEEYFFRGALHLAFADRRPGLATVVVYTLVTVVTLNPALVVAAAVMGTVFTLERLATGRVLAPAMTHLVWGLLMLLAFPR